MNGPLVFIHGQRFALGRSGLALRTRLAFDALSVACADRPRYLVSPDYPEVRNLAMRAGWTFVPVSSFIERQPLIIRLLLRLTCFWSASFSARMRDRLLTMLGGADIPSRPVERIFAQFPHATVWLSRCDLLHLTRLVGPNHRVILDSNDSVTNLVRCYDPRRRVRLLAGYSRSGINRLIESHELDLAKRCDLIIAISPEDESFYRRSKPEAVVLEESCVATPKLEGSTINTIYDVGFMGSSHAGSVEAANNFLRLARDPRLKGKRFAMAGGICSIYSSGCDAPVEMLGRVDSAPAFLAACRQVLLWSDGETGTSVKFQEAILSGSTVIANKSAARWSKAKPDRDYILCESEAEVVSHILAGTHIRAQGLISECAEHSLHQRLAKLIGPW